MVVDATADLDSPAGEVGVAAYEPEVSGLWVDGGVGFPHGGGDGFWGDGFYAIGGSCEGEE